MAAINRGESSDMGLLSIIREEAEVAVLTASRLGIPETKEHRHFSRL